MKESTKNPQKTIESFKKISKAITRSIDLEETLQTVVDEVMNHFTSIGGIVYLIEEKEKLIVPYKISTSKMGKFFLKAVGENIKKLTIPYEKPKNNIAKCVAEKKVFIGTKGVDFSYPIISKKIANTVQKTGNVKTLVAFPAIMNQKVIGAILLAFKEEEKIVQEKMETMELFVDQVAIAINNALKYEELRQKHKQLKQLYEIEKETSALLSHELKTPIAIAHNNAQRFQMLLNKKGKDFGGELEKLQKLQESIEDSITRMNNIANSIFNLREIENKVPEFLQEVDLKRLLEQSIQNYERKAKKKGLKFSYKLSEKAEKRFAAGIQLEQIMIILMDNAIKYTDEGKIEIKVELNKKEIIASISDTGIGIPKNQRKKIFERYKRINKNGEKSIASGLGVGLYIAKKILDQVKGDIKIKTAKGGKGSEFIVKMPVYDNIP